MLLFKLVTRTYRCYIKFEPKESGCFGDKRMDMGFVAVETFYPRQNYINWSRLFQVEQVVSIDCMLCPRVFEYSDKEFCHYVWLGHYFVYRDLDWLLSKLDNKTDMQILALIREPEMDCRAYVNDERLKFYGYNLLEDGTSISALTNCGGFDDVFLPSEISKFGLIEDYEKAKHIQTKLKENYPNEAHAHCALWAIWRME